MSQAEAYQQIVRTISRSQAETTVAIGLKQSPPKKPKEVVVKAFNHSKKLQNPAKTPKPRVKVARRNPAQKKRTTQKKKPK